MHLRPAAGGRGGRPGTTPRRGLWSTSSLAGIGTKDAAPSAGRPGEVDSSRSATRRWAAVAVAGGRLPAGRRRGAPVRRGHPPFSRAADVEVERGPDTTRSRRNAWGRRMSVIGRRTGPGRHPPSSTGPVAPACSPDGVRSRLRGRGTGSLPAHHVRSGAQAAERAPPDARRAAFERHEQASGPGWSSRDSWDVRSLSSVRRTAGHRRPHADRDRRLAAGRGLTEHLTSGTRTPRLRGALAAWNKWRTARYGLEAEVITADGPVPMRELVASWHARLAPLAERLGCRDDLDHALARACRPARSSPAWWPTPIGTTRVAWSRDETKEDR